MIVNKINIQDIKPYENNAKKHDETQIKNVAESIKQFGFVQPIVLDKNNEIVIGHCRYEASKLLGLEEVPGVRVDELTDEQVKKLRIVDNKANESPWDFDLLEQELENLDMDDFDFDFLVESEELDNDVEQKDLSESVSEIYEVVVECTDELQQEAVYTKLTSEGMKCRVLTL